MRGKIDKPDYRKALNTMLLFYYEHGGAYPITTELHRNGIHFKENDIHATIDTLIMDGHIKDVAPGHARIPVCAITGSGRVFYEQGGYQDNTTRFDKMIKWAKNNKFVAWLLIGFTVCAALVGLAVSVIAVYEFFTK